MVKADGELVTYRLTVSDTTVNITGKPTPMIATNGQIPSPTLYFTEGDTAQMLVTNRTERTVSFHWHGLLLPNEYDGVPLLNTELIHPSETHEFRFPVIQHGTYWYHSHTGFQEQKGQYGAIVIQPRQSIQKKEKVVVLSDFTTQNPHEVLRQLKKHTDWYAIKRDAVQSYGKALATGNLGAQAWLEWNRMPPMDLADVYYQAFLANGQTADEMSDLKPSETVRLRVINGSASSHFWLHFAGGEMTVVAADGIDVQPVKVDKLLIATAETYDIEVTLPAVGQYEFRATSWDRYKHTSVWLGEGEKVSATDLPPVDYYELVKQMKGMMKMMPDMVMGRAPKVRLGTELYVPEKAPSYQQIQMKSMEEMGMDMQMDGGMDMPKHDMGKMEKPSPGHEKMEGHDMKNGHDKMKNMEQEHAMDGHEKPKGKTFKAAEMDGKMMDMGHAKEPMGVMMTGYQQLKKANPDETIFDYQMLRAESPTVLSPNAPVRVVHLYLGGNMLRYVWTINNEPLSAADRIMIQQGEVVRFVFHNTTMMSHPMHLHGHFFRVINQHGDHSPLKHTVNVAPMEATIIEFAATEDRDWFFHCHLLYHMMSGMARVIGYQGTQGLLVDQDDYDKFALDDKKWFSMATVAAQNNGYWVRGGIFNIYNELRIEGNGDYDGEFEAEAKLMRYIGPKQFFAPYLGTEVEREEMPAIGDAPPEMEVNTVGLVGLRYFLPMLIWSDLRIDHEGNVQVELEREDIALTKRWRLEGGVEYHFNENKLEYTIGSSYILGQYIALSGNYDSDRGWGLGLKLIY
jgi:FtsP/CotA-like multicopper oxidase with cupredoxin domain